MQFTDLKSQYAALKSEIDSRIQRVLDHGQYIMGPEVGELEERLAAFSGTRHCVTVASGTEALLISLMALGIGHDDEVITTPFTFAATAEAIARVGARPVFVDVEPDTCNIDASLIESRITPRTRAILPVSLYGQCADMDEINAIGARHGVAVVEDAAQSFGALYKGRRSTALSTIGCTSFFPSKPLGCYGDGGALFTDDEALAQAAREIRVHGQVARYQHARVGVGGRMDTLQCAVVLAKLGRFDWELQRRAELARRYDAAISGHPQLLERGVRPVVVRGDRTSVYGQYTLWAPEREPIQAGLMARGIPTAVHYPRPLHRQAAYERFCCPHCCPQADAAARSVLSLPMSADLSFVDQDRILRALEASLQGGPAQPCSAQS